MFSNLAFILGTDYSFVIQTNLETLQKHLKFETRRDLAYKIYNFRIIYVINSGYTYMGKQIDPYFVCGITTKGSFAFGGVPPTQEIEFSIYDMTQQKYKMLHYVVHHDMFQNQMSFDYNDYYFGMKRKNVQGHTNNHSNNHSHNHTHSAKKSRNENKTESKIEPKIEPKTEVKSV